MTLHTEIRRPHDWATHLERYIEIRRDLPFAWWDNDCVTFAIGWIEEVRPDLEPREYLVQRDYSTAAGALRAMGGKTLEENVDAWGELPRIGVNFAQRGDLVLVDVQDRLSLAVCVGDRAAGPGAGGLVFLPMTAAVAAWRV